MCNRTGLLLFFLLFLAFGAGFPICARGIPSIRTSTTGPHSSSPLGNGCEGQIVCGQTERTSCQTLLHPIQLYSLSPPPPNAVIKTMSAHSDLLGNGLKRSTMASSCITFFIEWSCRCLLGASCRKSAASEDERLCALHVLGGEGGVGGGGQ